MARRPNGPKFDKGTEYTLEVPLDASEVSDFEPGRPLRVVAEASDGAVFSEVVELDKAGRGSAKLGFDRPVSARVAIGPAEASDDEVLALQTINVDVSARRFTDNTVTLPVVKVSPYYWHFWWRFCRTFTIRGRILCPDGSPVPGAKICAYDVDFWWWWCSRQEVGCDVTDGNGAFSITFRWCCGWWPWWWWRTRNWLLDHHLADVLMPVLQNDLGVPNPPPPSPKPDLRIFETVLADNNVLRVEPQSEIQSSALESLRTRLLPRLPQLPNSLSGLLIWPWRPWRPWWDCTPDIIFHATQECDGQERVIIDEHCFNTRWNIPTTLDVTLVAHDACCAEQEDRPEGNCLVISHACDDLVKYIGGNPDAPAAPLGYRNPGLAATHGDRPYARNVPLRGVFGDGTNVDFYEFEWSDDGGATWNAMPDAGAGGFGRTYWGPRLGGGPIGFHSVPFSFTNKNGQRVIMSREHFEETNDPLSWGITRLWVSNLTMLMVWRTEGVFADGTYRLRLRSYSVDGGGNLQGVGEILPLCNTKSDNEIVLTTDNRIVGAASGHPTRPDHPCGQGTVHVCTTEPDTDVISVSILRPGGAVVPVGACGNESIGPFDRVRIDFMAHDPDGHLAYYTLKATYGENDVNNLLSYLGDPGVSLVGIGGPDAPAAAQTGPTYGHARQPVQGAIAPTWNGGTMRLEMPALKAFPKTCCYQLELWAYKRTIASCNDSYPYRNLTNFTFGITVANILLPLAEETAAVADVSQDAMLVERD